MELKNRKKIRLMNSRIGTCRGLYYCYYLAFRKRISFLRKENNQFTIFS